jgi:hypothetical protein
MQIRTSASTERRLVIAARPALAGTAAGHEITKSRPLILAQRSDIPKHRDRSLKISLESWKSLGENPPDAKIVATP